MDALASLLDGPRARGAFLLRSILMPPWSLRIQDRAPLTLIWVAYGAAWVLRGQGNTDGDGAAKPVRLGPGDVAIVRGPEPYTVADHPETPPRIVIDPGQHCRSLTGEPLADTMHLGVRTWGDTAALDLLAAEPGSLPAGVATTGTDAAGTDTIGTETIGTETIGTETIGTETVPGPVVMFTGTYEMAGAINDRLLRSLPGLLTLTADEWDSALLGLLGGEIGRERPGQEVFLDRLLDLLLISVLRSWFSRPGATAPAWYRADTDPVIGPAMRLLHDDPAGPWTVSALAARTGVSRSAFAQRFTDLVGEPPMSYLTGWRLALAADLLREPGTTIAAAARKVGYGSPYALSVAFKRVHGVSPRVYRSRHRTGGGSPDGAGRGR